MGLPAVRGQMLLIPVPEAYISKAWELFLWEINDDILKLKLFHPELIEEGEKYADSGWVNQKWFKESEYHWMYQLRPVPERAEDYNEYFVCADEKHKLPWRTMTTWFQKSKTDSGYPL